MRQKSKVLRKSPTGKSRGTFWRWNLNLYNLWNIIPMKLENKNHWPAFMIGLYLSPTERNLKIGDILKWNVLEFVLNYIYLYCNAIK
jgi:hypothetical protein